MGGKETLRRRRIPLPTTLGRSLIVVESADQTAVGKNIPLTREGCVIGREGDVAIDDPRLSRKHAKVSLEDNALIAGDLGGTNGTFVDGATISKATLRAGSVLSIGDTLLVVDADPDPDDLPASEAASSEEASEVVGISRATVQLRRAISTVARSKGTVLLLGPTGAGKEVAARAIHRLSERSGPLVAVNCAAIPVELAESEFFGYRRGAFTGAIQDKEGFFVRAAGGTLFLDEVGDLPVVLQAKLLRVLEDRSVQVVGDAQPITVDVRIVAATHIELDDTSFRNDLLARLGDWTLHLPSLAERKADVLVLFRHFLKEQSPELRELTTELCEALLLHSWTMNVRELKKLAQRVSQLARPDEPLDLHLLPSGMQELLRARMLGEIENAPSNEQLEAIMKASLGNVTVAAQRHGWHRTQLYRWLRRAGINPKDFRANE